MKWCRVARGEQQLFHAGYALEWVHIDIMGPLVETQKGNKYILVIVDQFTKWVEAFPLKNQLAETVAGVVVREFVARFGCPLEIHTDQGRNFESELFKEMCELLEIGKARTTSYRPYANGQVERYNRSIAQIIRYCIGDRQESWDDFVGIAVGAIRETVNRSTGFTPNRMMLGREVMMPLQSCMYNTLRYKVFYYWCLYNICTVVSTTLQQQAITSDTTVITLRYHNYEPSSDTQ